MSLGASMALQPLCSSTQFLTAQTGFADVGYCSATAAIHQDVLWITQQVLSIQITCNSRCMQIFRSFCSIVQLLELLDLGNQPQVAKNIKLKQINITQFYATDIKIMYMGPHSSNFKSISVKEWCGVSDHTIL